ncbi:MAG: hypothetical protein AAB378_03130 [Patescibacteria group bacterium]
MTNRKNLIIIISAILLLIILGWVLIYYFYIRSVPAEQRGALGRLFPAPAERPTIPSEIPGQITPPETMEKVRLIHLTDVAIAGMKEMPFDRVRYIEKSTGHVYEIGGDGSNRVRISNTTIPKIWSAEWSPKGDKAVLGIFDDSGIKYFSATFNGTSTEGVFLPNDINFGAYAPNTDKIVYTTILNSKTNLISVNASNTKQDKIYIAPPVDFLLTWPATNTISLLTRPSGAADGFLYKLDIKSKILEKITGNLKGLDVSWSNKGNMILTSFGGAKMSSRVILSTGEFVAEGPATLASKCAWSHTKEAAIYCAIPAAARIGFYPDDWFQGKIAFSDYIEAIDFASSTVKFIMGVSNFDIQKMIVGQNDKYLYFIDKNDGTLWGLSIE